MALTAWCIQGNNRELDRWLRLLFRQVAHRSEDACYRPEEAAMSETVRRKMSVSELYDWMTTQTEGRYQLVDGEPLMMAGASRRNDRIAVNAIRLAGNHLEGHRCQPFTSDTCIAIPAGNRRQADMGIECGAPDDSSLEADAPTLVMEILSPTTRLLDRYEKLEEYKTILTLEYIVLVHPDYPQVRVYRRQPDRNWDS